MESSAPLTAVGLSVELRAPLFLGGFGGASCSRIELIGQPFYTDLRAA